MSLMFAALKKLESPSAAAAEPVSRARRPLPLSVPAVTLAVAAALVGGWWLGNDIGAARAGAVAATGVAAATPAEAMRSEAPPVADSQVAANAAAIESDGQRALPAVHIDADGTRSPVGDDVPFASASAAALATSTAQSARPGEAMATVAATNPGVSPEPLGAPRPSPEPLGAPRPSPEPQNLSSPAPARFVATASAVPGSPLPADAPQGRDAASPPAARVDSDAAPLHDAAAAAASANPSAGPDSSVDSDAAGARAVSRSVAALELAVQAGDVDSAQLEIDRLATLLPPQSLTLLRMRAWMAHQTGDSAGALTLYRQIVERMPDDQTTAINLAILEAHSGQVDSARQRLRRLRNSDTDSRTIDRAIAQVEATLR